MEDKENSSTIRCSEVEDSDAEEEFLSVQTLELENEDQEAISERKKALQDILEMKSKGNEDYKDGKYKEALVGYTRALQFCQEENKKAHCLSDSKNDSFIAELNEVIATLYSNVSATANRMGKYQPAIEAAQKATLFRPSWSKPYQRMAEAYFKQGKFTAATGALKKGESLCKRSATGKTELTDFYDRMTVLATVEGKDHVYSGRRLEVRSAGDDAWLGKPAPHDPRLDGPLDESTALPSDNLSEISNQSQVIDLKLTGGDALAQWDYSNASMQAQRTSFRCLKEAYKAAQDGDRIVLLKGVHNGLGECLVINKRILIEGEEGFGEVIIDQRANVPTFKIVRSGVTIRNITLDQTGFREAILIDGSTCIIPLIERCDIKCSGDDGVHVAGKAMPIIRFCRIQGKKVGIKCFEHSKLSIEKCIIEKCGIQGMSIMEDATCTAWHVTISDNGEDGVVVMGHAKVDFHDSRIFNNKGPGFDSSDFSRLVIDKCDVLDNVGGCWVWDQGEICIKSSSLSGGPAHVLLVDGNGSISASKCEIRGSIHAPGRVWRNGLEGGKNKFLDPSQPIDFPTGEPFRFEPSMYTKI